MHLSSENPVSRFCFRNATRTATPRDVRERGWPEWGGGEAAGGGAGTGDEEAEGDVAAADGVLA